MTTTHYFPRVSTTPANLAGSPEEQKFLLRVQPDGRAAEIVIDTGLPLRSGKTWQAYAKVFCCDVFHAEMMAERIRERIGDAVEQARRDAYQRGYRDARRKRRPLNKFSRSL